LGVRKELVKANLLSRRRAASHAATHLHVGVATKTTGMAEWRGANLGRLVAVYDLNDQPLFYDFPVVSRKGENLGLIRTSASRVLGVPVPSVYLGPAPWDVGKASLKASELVNREYGGKVVRTRLVCYAYPKLGISVEWEKRDEPGTRRTIVDIGDFSIVPERAEPGMRGPGAWSFYDHIPENRVPEAVEHFASYEKMVDELQERSGKNLAVDLKLYEFKSVQETIGAIIQIPLFTTKILGFCTHGSSHECFRMHGQENGVWCVVATGQMILDFWRYYNSQTAIATAMGTGSGGTSWNGEVNGLESLTCNHFDAQSDLSPTFSKAKAEIDANRPFDYSYSYHAMACVGYRQQNFYVFGTQPVNSVLLYDPSPVNVGTIRWETWGAGISPVAGFVYLRRP